MRKFFSRLRSRSAVQFLPVLVGLLVIMAIFSMRLITSAEWNSWALQYMWHALGTKHTHELSASIPDGHDRAKIWLAQDALASGNNQRALALVDPLALQNDPFALRIQAAAMEKQGDFTGELQTLMRAQDARLLIKFGNNMVSANHQADALEAFDAALAIDPEIGALPLANYLTNNKGDLLGADTVLRRALVAYPVSDQRLYWYRRLGDNLRKQKSFDDAEAVYQAAGVEFPNDWAIHIGLGWVYYERGEGVQKAIQEFQKAIDLDKARGDGYFAVAQVLTLEQRFVEADTWYSLALKQSPTYNFWFIAGANNARSAGNLDLALSIYRETVRKFPDYSMAYYEMAQAYRLNKQLVEAQNSIEKALSLMNPPNVSYYVRAGQIFEWSGETVRALEDYRKALAIDPNNSTAQKGVSRLSGP